MNSQSFEKIIVIGCPGSGKSTFSRALHQITGIPLFHLDMLYWNTDKTTVERAVFLEKLFRVVQKDQWIIDGNYSSTMELRLQACDTVIFLDYPAEVCLEGIRQRQGKPRSDMPWTETKEDPEFIQYVKDFHHQSRPQIIEMLGKYPDKNIHIFTNRTQADTFLQQK